MNSKFWAIAFLSMTLSADSCLGQLWTEEQKLVADDGATTDFFGISVSVSEGRALIGAAGDDGAAGASYVFEKVGLGEWNEVAKLTADDRAANDFFGDSVCIDGDRAIVGSAGDDDDGNVSGSAYIFERNGDGSWSQVDKLKASDAAAGDNFGFAVALDGDRALIGAYDNEDAGSAYVFERGSSGDWNEMDKLTPDDSAAGALFGCSVSLDGNLALVGAYLDDAVATDSGAAYVFERQINGDWTQVTKLMADDGAAEDSFGYSVCLSGQQALVGAFGDDNVGENSGSAYLFEIDETASWTPVDKLTADGAAAGDLFGWSVVLSGDQALIGASRFDNGNVTDAGAAYLFRRVDSGSWTQTERLTASDGADYDLFGRAVGLSDNNAVVGAYADDDGGAASGSAYAYLGPEPARGCPLGFALDHADLAFPLGFTTTGACLQLAREFRDTVLNKSKGGAELARLYYAHSAELKRIMARNPELMAETIQLVFHVLPAIRRASANEGDLVLSNKSYTRGKRLIERYMAAGSRELRLALAHVQSALQGRRRNIGEMVVLDLSEIPATN